MGDVFVNRMENTDMILSDVLGFDTTAYIPVELSEPMQYGQNRLEKLIPVNQPKIILPNRTVPIMELGKRLLQSSRDGDTDAVRELMRKGAPFSTDWLGTSPLHFAAQGNHIKTCEALLRAGISKDARTKVDRTPLHMASYEGHASIVELLLKNGADIDSKDMLKMTPLHWAVQNEHLECIEVLLHYGATVDVISKFDKTPISMAVEQSRMDIVQKLQQAMKSNAERVQNMELQRATLAATQSLTQELREESNDTCVSEKSEIVDNLIISEAPPLEPIKSSPIKVKGRKVITLRSDQFLALTGGKYQHMFKKLSNVTTDVKPIKRIVMTKNKITVAPKAIQLGQVKINTLEKIETITKQLQEARRIAEEYKQKYKQKEKECEEYEKQLKFLTFL